jgi:hypothetical protein
MVGILLVFLFLFLGKLVFPIFHSHIGFLVLERSTLVEAMIDRWHLKHNYEITFGYIWCPLPCHNHNLGS